MSKKGPIIIVEDDADDKDMLEQAIRELQVHNKILWFDNTDVAFDYLNTTNEKTFILFCDINMPGMNGLEFKTRIDENPKLRKQSIPFVFLSTSARQHDVNDAYTKMSIQGFFVKSADYTEMKHEIGVIIEYWTLCRHPNN